MFDADRLARFNGEPPQMVPVVAEDPLAPSALPTLDSWQWFTETAAYVKGFEASSSVERDFLVEHLGG
jgi:hypothetical protein